MSDVISNPRPLESQIIAAQLVGASESLAALSSELRMCGQHYAADVALRWSEKYLEKSREVLQGETT